jgi:hypothetical protein
LIGYNPTLVILSSFCIIISSAFSFDLFIPIYGAVTFGPAIPSGQVNDNDDISNLGKLYKDFLPENEPVPLDKIFEGI